jgi:hypothetical protein
MRILVRPNEPHVAGTPVYRKGEHSFDFLPAHPERLARAERTSIVIGTLQIEVAIPGGLLLFVWGYNPSATWQRGVVPDRTAAVAALGVESEEPLVRGVSVRVGSSPAWITRYDPRNDWVGVVQMESEAEEYFEFATGTIAGLNHEGKLVELLIKPAFLD